MVRHDSSRGRVRCRVMQATRMTFTPPRARSRADGRYYATLHASVTIFAHGDADDDTAQEYFAACAARARTTGRARRAMLRFSIPRNANRFHERRPCRLISRRIQISRVTFAKAMATISCAIFDYCHGNIAYFCKPTRITLLRQSISRIALQCF